MSPPNFPSPEMAERLAAIERRLARLEARLATETSVGGSPEPVSPLAVPAASSAEELELEVGQNWFALAGVAALTLGAALLLALPWAEVPPFVPPLVGYAAVAALFILAKRWSEAFSLVARYVRGSAMGLLFLAGLRWSFPISHRVLEVDSTAARALLIATVAVNAWIALRRRSPWLTGLALACGGGMIATSGAPGLAFGGIVGLAGAATIVCMRQNWRALAVAVAPATYACYLGFALGPLLQPGAGHFTLNPAAPATVLACVAILGTGWWWCRPGENDEAWLAVHAVLNCLFGYGVFFVHTAAAFPQGLALAHLFAFVVLLGLAIGFWRRRRNRGATFFYAMTGYAALSVAILKAAPPPAVFIWLSLQSLIVVTTAIWFRSRFIVVANFSIFVGIVLAYVFVAERETGISLGFGLVALVSARILNWQKHRLELKTELMRNAYLASAFVVFPYALYHLVPARFAAIAWVGLAAVYYGFNLIGRNAKYRWMGHATLLLTLVYVVFVGVSRFEPVYRVLSFLVLGAVLLVVSLSFTRARQRRGMR